MNTMEPETDRPRTVDECSFPAEGGPDAPAPARLAAPRRRLAAAAALPFVLQALLFQVATAAGWLRLDAVDVRVVDGIGGAFTTYRYYGGFGPYLISDLVLHYLPRIALVVAVVAVVAVEVHARRSSTTSSRGVAA